MSELQQKPIRTYRTMLHPLSNGTYKSGYSQPWGQSLIEGVN